MRRQQSFIVSQLLAAVVTAMLALPAWGAPLKNGSFGNMALVTQGDNNVLMTLARVATYSSPVAAMANLAKWCGVPAADNPCLVKILPGVYDLAGASLTMQPYVDIEGSGQSTTFITSAFGSSTLAGVVNGADHAELRFLTVSNTANSGSYVVAICNKSQSPRLTHLTATAGSGFMESHAVYNISSSPIMTDVTATGNGTGGFSASGVYNDNSSPVMNNVTATGGRANQCYGVFNTGSSPVMNNVTANGLQGNSTGAGVYNEKLSSPQMNNVTASGAASVFCYGVYNSGSSPVMRNVSASADGHNPRAVLNENSSAPVMDGVIAVGTGGTVTYGIWNQDSSPSMSNVTALGRIGLLNLGSNSTIQVDRSTFQGATSISNQGTMKIGGSKLSGQVEGDGLTCSGSYNGNFVALGANCR